MDDISFNKWGETLSKLRTDRNLFLQQRQHEKAEGFSPADFYEAVLPSFESVIENWFSYEQQFWNAFPPQNASAELNEIRADLNNVIHFEIDAISRDLALIRTHFHWENDLVEQQHAAFIAHTNETRTKYHLKVGLLAGGIRKREADLQPSVQMSFTSKPKGGGIMLVLMFLVGLVVGGGPSIYFWDNSKNAQQEMKLERQRSQAERRLMEDNLTNLRETFTQLANGQIKSLPDIEAAMATIERTYAAKKANSEKKYATWRERIVKKKEGVNTPLELNQWERERNSEMELMENEKIALLTPLKKQREILQALLKD